MMNEDPEAVWGGGWGDEPARSALVRWPFGPVGRQAGRWVADAARWLGGGGAGLAGRRLSWAGRAGGVARGGRARGAAAGYQALAWARAASGRRGSARPSGSHTWSAGLPSVWTPVARGTSAGGGRRRSAASRWGVGVQTRTGVAMPLPS